MGRRWVVVGGLLGLGFACGACGDDAGGGDTAADTRVEDTRVDEGDAQLDDGDTRVDDGDTRVEDTRVEDSRVEDGDTRVDDGDTSIDDGDTRVDDGDVGEVGPDTAAPAPRAFFTFQSADRVIGQPDFVSGSQRELGGNSFSFMWGSPELVDGVLFLPNYSGNRVLGFIGVPESADTPADFVLGQEDFVSTGSGDLADEMAGPQTVRAHRGRLYVDDYENNRVSVYRQIPRAHAVPDFVIGQPAFGLSEARCSDRGLSAPEDVALVGDRLIVADAGNNRVLIWEAIPDDFDVPADVVLGQAGFTTCAENDDDADGARDASPSARTLSYPGGVWSDGQRLFVADSGNRRVLVWEAIPTESFAPADFVLGQPDMTSSEEREPSEGFGYPCYIAGDEERTVLVDADWNRVLGWNGPIDGPRAPDFVLGQSDLEHIGDNDDDQDGRADAGPSARTFKSPVGVVMRDGELFVADGDNFRYLRFSAAVCAPGRFESPAGSGRCVDDPCEPSPCGAGSCVRSGEVAVCSCPAETFGANCSPCRCGAGTCNSGPSGDGTCTCPTGATGASCEQCEDGYFGAACAACPACQGGCSDGKGGTGECLCADERYGGVACDTCAFGRRGAGCDGYFTSCSAIKSAQPGAPTRAYVIDPDGVGGGAPMTVDCDMDTDGGGWTLVMNYVHAGGTNPELVVLDGALPRLGDGTLGDDESGTASWGQGASSLLARLDPGEVRFEGRTSAHARVVSFTTSNVLCVGMLMGGTGSCVSLEPYAILPGHTANLPKAQSEGRTAVAGVDTLTDFPFHSIDGFHWNVRAQGGRWDVDDNADSDRNDTIQRVWVRSECEDGRAGRSCEKVCPDCGSHGRCDEGRAGTGLCVCDAGWTGGTCATPCPSGVAGLSCDPLASCQAIHAAFPAAPSGVYAIDVDGAGPLATMDAYCDMSTDGGGWTLVLDYLHAGGTNPARMYRRTSLPLKGGEVLGEDESLSSTWGHASPSLLGSMPAFGEVRFMCKTSGHGRVLDFKTTSSRCVSYFRTGSGRCDDVATTSTTLPGHTANLPLAATDSFNDYGQRALVEFPFYRSGNYHWGIRGRDERWECDDFPIGPQSSTLHRVFVR